MNDANNLTFIRPIPGLNQQRYYLYQDASGQEFILDQEAHNRQLQPNIRLSKADKLSLYYS